MKYVTITVAKANLSSLLEEAADGAIIVITKYGKPLAMLVPLSYEASERGRQ